MNLPTEVPVMVLPDAILFPSTALPLFIFEDRYRDMLDHVLETHRMFSVALAKPGVEEATGESDFFQVGGLGLVRACVGRDDGTSSLMLLGIARVRYTGFVQTQPFRIARIERINSVQGDAPPAAADEAGVTSRLGRELVDLCGRMRRKGVHLPARLRNGLDASASPEVVTDLLASEFVPDPLVRQKLLEEPVLERRIRLLLRFLTHYGE